MTLHIRKQLRAALVAALNAVPALTDRVTDRRVFDFKPGELPQLIVVSTSDDAAAVAPNASAPRAIKRNVRLVVVIAVADTAEMPDALDTLAGLVEAAAFVDPSLGGIADDLAYVGTDIVLPGPEEDAVGTAAVKFLAVVHGREGDGTAVRRSGRSGSYRARLAAMKAGWPTASPKSASGWRHSAS